MMMKNTSNVTIKLLVATFKWFFVAILFFYLIAVFMENCDYIIKTISHIIKTIITIDMDYFYLSLFTQGLLSLGVAFLVNMHINHKTLIKNWPVYKMVLLAVVIYASVLTSFFVSYSSADLSAFQVVFYLSAFMMLGLVVAGLLALLPYIE